MFQKLSQKLFQKIKSKLKSVSARAINSRFFLFIITLIIGITYTMVVYEWQKIGADLVSAGSPADSGLVVWSQTDITVEGPQGSPLGPDIKLIVDKIHQLESSQGKNNYSRCTAQNKYNEFGYGIHGDNYLCFEKGKDREAVERWFQKKLETLSVAQATCLYNTGRATDDCPYFNKFNQII